MLVDVDVAILVTLVAAFALLVTAHLALSALLLFRSPWWKGLLALFVLPLAPYLGYESGLKVWAALWIVGVFVYSVALIAAMSI